MSENTPKRYHPVHVGIHWLMAFPGVFIVFLIAIVATIFIYYRQKNKANKLLAEKNIQIEKSYQRTITELEDLKEEVKTNAIPDLIRDL